MRSFLYVQARNLRAVVVSTPSSVKSFMLKFLEICHNLNRQRNLALEKTEKKAVQRIFTISNIRSLLGLGAGKTFSTGSEIFLSINTINFNMHLSINLNVDLFQASYLKKKLFLSASKRDLRNESLS